MAITSPLTLKLTEGLNLVSIPYFNGTLTAHSLLEGQSHQIPGCTMVQRWNTSTGTWEKTYIYNGRIFGNDFPITPGYGYFITVSSNTTWTPESHNSPSHIQKQEPSRTNHRVGFHKGTMQSMEYMSNFHRFSSDTGINLNEMGASFLILIPSSQKTN